MLHFILRLKFEPTPKKITTNGKKENFELFWFLSF